MNLPILSSWPWNRAKRLTQKVLLPSPVLARHSEYSMLFSADAARVEWSDRLLDLSLRAITAARTQDLTSIQSRLRGRFRFPDSIVSTWPGEHYKLLAGLVQALAPLQVVEIGTAEGISALALKKHLPGNGKAITFDIIQWRDYPNTCLVEQDFADLRLGQVVADLGDAGVFERHRTFLEQTDLFFVDASKDGSFERRLIRHLNSLNYRKPPIVLFDDIRVWNMLAIWHELKWPKLDLTSFGHWSGTGICEMAKK